MIWLSETRNELLLFKQQQKYRFDSKFYSIRQQLKLLTKKNQKMPWETL